MSVLGCWWRSVVADQGRQGASCHVGFPACLMFRGAPVVGSGGCSSMLGRDRTELMLCDDARRGVSFGGEGWWWASA